MLSNSRLYCKSVKREKNAVKEKCSDSYANALPTAKRYFNLCFFHSLHQVIMEPDHSKMLIDNIITKSLEKNNSEWHY